LIKGEKERENSRKGGEGEERKNLRKRGLSIYIPPFGKRGARGDLPMPQSQYHDSPKHV
jgi:hypothetical protein